MLTGRHQAVVGEDQLRETPSSWTTMSDSFLAHYGTPAQFLPIAAEDRDSINFSIRNLEANANAGQQGIGQKSLGWVGGILGDVLNPLGALSTTVGGAITGKALSWTGSLVGRHLPFEVQTLAKAIGGLKLGKTFGFESPQILAKQTLAATGKNIAEGAVIGDLLGAPQRIADTYDTKTHHFDYWGGVKAAAGDTGLSLGLMVVPYLGGTLWGKLFRNISRELPIPEMPMPGEGRSGTHVAFPMIEEGVKKGRLTPAEGQWAKDYVMGNITASELESRASELLIRDGHPVDGATNKVLLKLFSPEDVEHLQRSLADELASTHVPEDMRGMISEFNTHKIVDDFSGANMSRMTAGLEGVVKFLQKRLAQEPEARVLRNKLLKELAPSKEEGINHLSQKEIYRAVKRGENVKVIPPEVKRALKHDAQGGLAGERPSLLSHKEEMEFIRNDLLPKDEVRNNFQVRQSYERLRHLALVRNDAKRLLHEVHTRHEVNLQKDYATFLDAMTHIMRKNVTKLASADNVLNYLKERSIPVRSEFENIEEQVVRESENITQQEAKSAGEIKPPDLETIENQMKDAPEDLRKEYDTLKKQFSEFTESKHIFQNLISCIRGE